MYFIHLSKANYAPFCASLTFAIADMIFTSPVVILYVKFYKCPDKLHLNIKEKHGTVMQWCSVSKNKFSA